MVCDDCSECLGGGVCIGMCAAGDDDSGRPVLLWSSVEGADEVDGGGELLEPELVGVLRFALAPPKLRGERLGDCRKSRKPRRSVLFGAPST